MAVWPGSVLPSFPTFSKGGVTPHWGGVTPHWLVGAPGGEGAYIFSHPATILPVMGGGPGSRWSSAAAWVAPKPQAGWAGGILKPPTRRQRESEWVAAGGNRNSQGSWLLQGKLFSHSERSSSWIEVDLLPTLLNLYLTFSPTALSCEIQPARESCCMWRGILGRYAADWMALTHPGSILDSPTKALGRVPSLKGHNLDPPPPKSNLHQIWWVVGGALAGDVSKNPVYTHS